MDLDYTGLVYVASGSDNRKELRGHAWKVFPIAVEYLITPNTHLTFQMTPARIENVNARALCVDFDDVLSNMRRCIYLGGQDVDYHLPFNPNTRPFDFQRAKIWNLALEGTAEQSSSSKKGITEAYNANDGIIDPRDKSMVNVATNSISKTKSGPGQFWQVKFSENKDMAQIFIHKVPDYPLQKFQVLLCTTLESCPEETGDNVCLNEDCNSESLTNAVRIFKYTNNNDSVFVINLPASSSAHVVRVERTDSGILALAEVIISPSNGDDSGPLQYNIPVGKMLSEGISFGYPIWDGVESLLNVDNVVGEDGVLTLSAAHLITNVVVIIAHGTVSEVTEVTATVQYNESMENRCSVTATGSENTFHLVFPPNCIGNKITTTHSSDISKIEAFGKQEPVPLEEVTISDGTEGEEPTSDTFPFQTVYGRPKIRHIGMIQKINGGSNQDDPNDGLIEIITTFENFAFVENDRDNSDIGRVSSWPYEFHLIFCTIQFFILISLLEFLVSANHYRWRIF